MINQGRAVICGLVIVLTAAWRLNAANVPPTVSVAPNLSVELPRTGVLAALVTDDGLPTGAEVTNMWTKVSGPGTVTFSDPFSPITEAKFSVAGSYSVRLTAWDGNLTNRADVAVTVVASPLTLHVMFSGTGSGTVSGKGIYSTNNCTRRYSAATNVTLLATAGAGSAFRGWVGTGYTGMKNPCTVTIDQAKDITAFFDAEGTGTTTKWVSTTGDDANSGTETSPWRHINYAAGQVSPGTRVMIKAGRYYEFVTNRLSGTAQNPIVFEGERGPGGEWLTIIDPSTDFSTGWVAAPEMGAGAWKKTDCPFQPAELTIDGKRVASVYTLGDLTAESSAQYTNRATGLWIKNGSEYFGLSSNALVTCLGNGILLRFWDGLEALWGTTTTSPYTVYLRFRNGDNPNGKAVRAAPNRNGIMAETTIYGAAINANRCSNLVFRNLKIQGAYCGIFLGRNGSEFNTAENNYISGGLFRIRIGDDDGATRPGACVIRNNDLVSNFYGYSDAGARQNAEGYRYAIRYALYINSKYMMGHQSTWDTGVFILWGGSGNVIRGNHIYNGFGGDGLYIWTPAGPSSEGLVVADNTIENQSSTGFLFLTGQTNMRVFDNRVSDCNINMRLGMIGASGETNRQIYIYRNRFSLPDGAGEHVFFHFNDDTPDTYFPTFWIYNNSFSGGFDCFSWNAYALSAGGTRNAYILNNVLSGMSYPMVWWPSGFSTNASYVGGFDYNLLSPVTDPAWMGTHNVEQTSTEWLNSPGLSFALAGNSAAVDAALDTTTSFVFMGTSFPALPQTNARKLGAAWDMGAYEVDGFSVFPPARIRVTGLVP